MSGEYTCLGDWERAASILSKEETDLHFKLGEWLNGGDRFIPDDESRYKRAHELTELSVQHLRNVACVTRSVPAYLRKYAVKWNHYVVVAPLPPEEQAQWLKRAEDEKLTVSEFRRMLKGDEPPDVEPPEQPVSGTLALLSALEWSRLCASAARLGKTPAELAREILVQWLNEEEKAHAGDTFDKSSEEAAATVN